MILYLKVWCITSRTMIMLSILMYVKLRSLIYGHLTSLCVCADGGGVVVDLLAQPAMAEAGALPTGLDGLRDPPPPGLHAAETGVG